MESKGRINHYEGMFLVSQASAHDLGATMTHIRDIILRGKGEIVAFKKWDERRLAYEIGGHKRGVYFLSYFTADPAFLADIERASNLSETILRYMVTRVEHLTEDQMRAEDESGRLADEAKVRGADDGESEDAPSEPKVAADEPVEEAPAEVPAAEG